jgi:hypothetical protein
MPSTDTYDCVCVCRTCDGIGVNFMPQIISMAMSPVFDEIITFTGACEHRK